MLILTRKMGISQPAIFLLTFLVFMVLVIILKRNRQLDQEVVVYSIGSVEFEENGNDGKIIS